MYRLQNGTTYNSFLIFGEDKTALVDASHEKFRGMYIDVLKEELKKAGRKLDYIFISHTEPDHSGMPLLSRRGVLDPPPSWHLSGALFGCSENIVHKKKLHTASKGGGGTCSVHSINIGPYPAKR